MKVCHIFRSNIMSNFFKQLIVALLMVTSCKSNSSVEQVADSFELYSNEQSSFESVESNVKEKRILILGESGHGDGKTFEIKSKLIEYLNANDEYDVLLEGMGVLDAAVLQGGCHHCVSTAIILMLPMLGIHFGVRRKKFLC